GCASYLVFHDYYTIEQQRLVKAHTCKKALLCPFCAARRAAKMVGKNAERVRTAMAAERSLEPVMITLTIKNGPSLRERYNHLRTALRRLQQRRRDCLKGKAWTEFARVRGAIHSIEITNKGQGWHPHVHMIALVDSWIDREALSREWQDITGDSFIVDVRRIKPKASELEAGGVSIEDGLAEVFKYALKFSDLSLEDTWHAYELLKGRRLVDGFGCLRGVEIPDKLLDDPLEGLPFLELVYKFSRAKSAYDLERTTRYPHGLPQAEGEGAMEASNRSALSDVPEWSYKYVTKSEGDDCYDTDCFSTGPGLVRYDDFGSRSSGRLRTAKALPGTEPLAPVGRAGDTDAGAGPVRA
ncbi:MAG: protein rep, partial [Gillisia sp.]